MSDTSKNENKGGSEGRKKIRVTYCKCFRCGKRTKEGEMAGNIFCYTRTSSSIRASCRDQKVCSECYDKLQKN